MLASYDSMVAYGQERVLVCWQRLIRPDGSSLSLDCQPGVDLGGYAGFADTVDNHWWRVLTGVALGSVLAAGVVVPRATSAAIVPTIGQGMAANAAGAVNQAGQQITSRALNIQPTIKVRPGFSVNVLVTKDLIIPPYRAEGVTTMSQPQHPSDGRGRRLLESENVNDLSDLFRPLFEPARRAACAGRGERLIDFIGLAEGEIEVRSNVSQPRVTPAPLSAPRSAQSAGLHGRDEANSHRGGASRPPSEGSIAEEARQAGSDSTHRRRDQSPARAWLRARGGREHPDRRRASS